jgi:hypothetical protein
MIAIGVGLFALAIYFWELTVPLYLGFYDTGVYLGASIHLVSGVLPYRDFTFVQPPGILLLMSPVAVVSRIFGSHDGFVMARYVSAIVSSLNVVMIAWLVRHRGRMSMLIAGAGLALIPVGILMTTVVRLDLYSVFFVLLASLTIFNDPQNLGRLSNRRLALAGALFGFAALVKLWAFFPFVALIICLVPSYRRRVGVVIGAAAATFFTICLPFLLSAPRNFVGQVFIEQLLRQATREDSAGLMARLTTLSGLLPTTSIPSHAEIIVSTVLVISLVVLAYSQRLEYESVDVYLLVATFAVGAALLTSRESYTYYGAYFAPFLLGVVGISAARLGRPLRKWLGRITISVRTRQFLRWSTVAGLAGVLFAMSLYLTALYSSYTWENGYSAKYLAPITAQIPSGSCVVYQSAAFGIETNRFQSDDPGCPNVVDAYGMWMAWGYMRIDPSPKFLAEWRSYFARAQYVVLSYYQFKPFKAGVTFNVVPWDRAQISWFKAHYHLEFRKRYVYIYEKDS